MMLFEFPDVEAFARFWQVVWELDAHTEKERSEILLDFAKHGELKRVQQTNRTKEQLIKDWSKEFTIRDITNGADN